MRRRRDDDDNYRKRGWRFLHRRREWKTAHGSTRAVNATKERPRSRRDDGVLDPAPRQIVRGRHDPWTSGIREARASRRLAVFCLVLAVRVGGRSRSGGGCVGGRGCRGVVVNVAGGVRQIRQDLATSRGGTIGKGGIANTPPGEGDALGNDVTVISIMNNTIL